MMSSIFPNNIVTAYSMSKLNGTSEILEYYFFRRSKEIISLGEPSHVFTLPREDDFFVIL